AVTRSAASGRFDAVSHSVFSSSFLPGVADGFGFVDDVVCAGGLLAAGFGFGLAPAVAAAEDGFLTGGDVVCAFGFDDEDLLAVAFDAPGVSLGFVAVVVFVSAGFL